jgi:hypothetical protein
MAPRSQFRAGDPRTVECARKGWIARNPSEAGKRSWAKRSPELREQMTKTLLAAFDPHASDQACARMYRDPAYVAEMQVWMEVGRMRAEAKRLGHVEPVVTRRRLVEIEEPYAPMMPAFVKNPGRSARKRKEREAREAAAKAAVEQSNGPPAPTITEASPPPHGGSSETIAAYLDRLRERSGLRLSEADFDE